MNRFFILTLAAAMAAAGLAGAAEAGRVTVTASGACPGPLPVVVDLPVGTTTPEIGAVSLRPDEGPALAGQVFDAADARRLAFVIPDGLAAGTRRQWRVEPADAGQASFSSSTKEGAAGLAFDGKPLAAWQWQPVAAPKGGDKFSISAFLHPLRTPSGFVVTALQPGDHLHHLGVWWPWKLVEVEGQSYITWEMQQGQGRHFSRTPPAIATGPACARLVGQAFTEIQPKNVPAQVVIDEEATMTAWRPSGDTWVLDIRVRQKARGTPVILPAYRYSGFSYRSTTAWTKDNSQLTTSEGHDRDQANGQPARWALVTGKADAGTASVLILSAASVRGTPERLRVWSSKDQNGMPFVNFNPVQEQPLPLDAAHPATSDRAYRLVIADRTLAAADAEAFWQAFAKPPQAAFAP